MEKLVIANSRRKYVFALLVAIPFLVAGVFILRSPNSTTLERTTGWLCVAAFGIKAADSIRGYFDSRPRLQINQDGIDDRTLGVGIIPWSEITDAYIKSIKGNDFVCLKVQDPIKWTSKLSTVRRMLVKTNRVLGFTELNINLIGTTVNTQQVHELILKLSAASKETGQ